MPTKALGMGNVSSSPLSSSKSSKLLVSMSLLKSGTTGATAKNGKKISSSFKLNIKIKESKDSIPTTKCLTKKLSCKLQIPNGLNLILVDYTRLLINWYWSF